MLCEEPQNPLPGLVLLHIYVQLSKEQVLDFSPPKHQATSSHLEGEFKPKKRRVSKGTYSEE